MLILGNGYGAPGLRHLTSQFLLELGFPNRCFVPADRDTGQETFLAILVEAQVIYTCVFIDSW